MNDLVPEVSEKIESAEIKLACLRVGEEFYALDIMCIREIIRPMPIIPVPQAPPFVEGVIHLRKTVIPIIDLRRRFGLQAPEQGKRIRIVICAVEGRVVGLVVDEVTEVCHFRREDIRPAPYYLSGAQSTFFPGICRRGEQLLMCIDLKQILASDEHIHMDQIHQQPSIADQGE